MSNIVQGVTAILALFAAASWLRAATVKVTREQAVEDAKRRAAAAGEEPGLAGVSLNGIDVWSTAAAQSRWNAIGASCAGGAALLQAAAIIRGGP